MSLGREFLEDHAYEIHNGWEPGIYLKTFNQNQKGKMAMPIPKPKMPVRAATPANKIADEVPAKIKITFGAIGKIQRGQFIILAGKGGTGKTTAACMKPGETAFIDLEGSLPILQGKLAAFAPERLEHIHTVPFAFTEDAAKDYESLCAAVEADGYDGMDTVVIDSWSVVQKLLKAYTFAHDQYKGKVCASTEDYGYSTFPIYAFKNYTRLMNAMLAHVRAGRDVVIVAHAVDDTVPDANLNDMKQWQFDAFMMKSGKESIRHDLFNSADQVWFMTDGVMGNDKKKASGGCRLVYLQCTPEFWAKSRTHSGEPGLAVNDGETIPWNEILGRAE